MATTVGGAEDLGSKLDLHRKQIVTSKYELNEIAYHIYETGAPTVTSAVNVYIHCSHGFGASGLSWVYLMECLKVSCHHSTHMVAHDTYGFGFTNRDDGEMDLKFATLEANGHAAVSILSRNLLPNCKRSAVFMGHSMGSISAICSALEWIDSGLDCRGIVLIAPAIKAGQLNEEVDKINVFFGALGSLLTLVFSGVTAMASLTLRRNALAGLLTIAVNIPFFWFFLLRYAFCGPVLSDSVVNYQLPMKRVNWRALLTDFIEANVWNCMS